MPSRTSSPLIDMARLSAGTCYAITRHNPTLSATTEIQLLLLRNPTSGATAKSLYVYQRRLTVTTAQSAIVRAYATPVVTVNGTAVVPTPLRVGGTASVMTAYTGSTSSDNGTLIDAQGSFNYAVGDVCESPILIPSGGLVMLTITASNTTCPLDYSLYFAEID